MYARSRSVGLLAAYLFEVRTSVESDKSHLSVSPMFAAALLVAGLVSVTAFTVAPHSRLLVRRLAEAKDAQGYLIKPKDWFNGLSLDPGASLTDPRAIPPVAREFADKIKGGAQVTFAEALKVIDDNYEYFAVPFKNGMNLCSATILCILCFTSE